jgi:SAM-dependent methyltransferase
MLGTVKLGIRDDAAGPASTTTPADGHVERLRRAELEVLKPHFKPGLRVLEIGGGSGFQAALIDSWGCSVTSIDIPGRSWPRSFFPVTFYDGQHLPFPDASFDIIFSSNVLEHVERLPGLLAETRRVTRAGGISIHVMPTSSWRLWTSLAHYVDLARRAFHRVTRVGARRAPAEQPGGEGLSTHPSLVAAMKRALLPAPHGEYPSAAAELYYFSKRRWLRVFADHGFEVEGVIDGDLFYTGRCLAPGLSHRGRRRLARILAPSARTFVVRATPGVSHSRTG